MSTKDPSTTETTVRITGMTCDHCIRAVTDELMTIEGVTTVSVDLHDGGVSAALVSSTGPLEDEDIRAAVDEAGYDIAGIDH